MRELLQQLTPLLHRGRAAAVCRLVETRGSTPQKAGAAMLVFPDGAQAGTLGGGCVEAEVKRRALAVLAEGEAEVVRFQLDDDYGWDDGLICGGRMQVLIDPLSNDAARDYFARLGQLADRGRGATEAIVFDAAASGLTPTASYLFDDQGQLLVHLRGSLEAGLAPAAIREAIEPLANRPRPATRHGIAVLPMLPHCRLVIVGGGHVGQAVGALAADLDFDVSVVDDRAVYVSPERFPRAQQRISGAIGEVLPKLEITPSTYCLIVTRGHNHDEEALYHLVDRGAAYVGMIGSQRKIKLIFDDLLAEGISPEILAKVYAPVGLEIGSQTVPEIAISIAAELVAHRNLGSAAYGRERSTAMAAIK
jgi:xanthine dehydrogenase accessory factor